MSSVPGPIVKSHCRACRYVNHNARKNIYNFSQRLSALVFVDVSSPLLRVIQVIQASARESFVSRLQLGLSAIWEVS